MTLAEFKAWLDGYLDGKDGLTAEQAAAVRAKLALVAIDWGTMPTPQFVPNQPNIIGPYWSPSIPSTAPATFPLYPQVTCGSQTIPHDPNIRLNN